MSKPVQWLVHRGGPRKPAHAFVAGMDEALCGRSGRQLVARWEPADLRDGADFVCRLCLLAVKRRQKRAEGAS